MKKKYIGIIVLIVIILEVFSVIVENKGMGLIICMSFIAIMLAILLGCWFFSIRHITQISMDLKKATDTMVITDNKLKIGFSTDTLKQKVKLYEHDLEKGRKVTIKEYINMDVLNDLAYREIMQQVPLLLCAVGLVGNLCGLFLGILSFDVSKFAEAEEVITEMTQIIKISFLTSASGLLLAVLFAFFFKSRDTELVKHLEAFLEKCNGVRPETRAPQPVALPAPAKEEKEETKTEETKQVVVHSSMNEETVRYFDQKYRNLVEDTDVVISNRTFYLLNRIDDLKTVQRELVQNMKQNRTSLDRIEKMLNDMYYMDSEESSDEDDSDEFHLI